MSKNIFKVWVKKFPAIYNLKMTYCCRKLGSIWPKSDEFWYFVNLVFYSLISCNKSKAINYYSNFILMSNIFTVIFSFMCSDFYFKVDRNLLTMLPTKQPKPNQPKNNYIFMKFRFHSPYCFDSLQFTLFH